MSQEAEGNCASGWQDQEPLKETKSAVPHSKEGVQAVNDLRPRLLFGEDGRIPNGHKGGF